ncbi:transposase [Aeromonas sobria]|uniref:transposase n=1 Tax=Aeromonas sobria TaxID=646 RepID=UPI003D06E4C0
MTRQHLSPNRTQPLRHKAKGNGQDAWHNKLHADKGYDCRRCRDYLRQCGIKVHIARRGIDCNERLGCHRWIVERTHGWLAGVGKLRIPFKRQLDMPC